MNVLIVEDDPNLRALWRAVMAEMNYLVHEAETLASAQTALRAARFDLVLLDLYLGQDSALSLVSQANAASPDCKIVIVTGSSHYGNGELFDISSSVASVLRKPVDVEDLIATCESVAEPLAASARQG
ncbi:MAG: response regulator [Pseudomonadota bacterium]